MKLGAAPCWCGGDRRCNIDPKIQSLAWLTQKTHREKREKLFVEIQEKALCWCIGRAEPEEIDEINILHATMLAMQRAVAGLSITPDFVLVDGNRCPTLSMPSQAVIKGDSLVQEISAASILAKVVRDREMVELDKAYPEYGFAKHKGYPTAYHLEKLAQFGATKFHRKSFAPVRRALEAKDWV